MYPPSGYNPMGPVPTNASIDDVYPSSVPLTSPMHRDYPYLVFYDTPIWWRVLLRLIGLASLGYLVFIGLFWSLHVAYYDADYFHNPRAYASVVSSYLDPATAHNPSEAAKAVAYLQTYWDWNALFSGADNGDFFGILLSIWQAVAVLTFIVQVCLVPIAYILYLFSNAGEYLQAGALYGKYVTTSFYFPINTGDGRAPIYFGESYTSSVPVGYGLSYDEFVRRRRSHALSQAFPFILPLPLFLLEFFFQLADGYPSP